MLGFSTVAHSVENRYGFLCALGDSGSGVGRSQAKSLAMPKRAIFARLVGTEKSETYVWKLTQLKFGT